MIEEPAARIEDRIKNAEVFPFTLVSTWKGHSDLRFQRTFLRAKPEEMTWYCYDVIVKSPSEVTFAVYDIYDNVYGVKGKKIAEVNAEADIALTAECINDRIQHMAKIFRAEELACIEQAIIDGYAARIKAAIGLNALETGESRQC